MREHYERWPYPQYPLLAKVSPTQLWQLHAGHLAQRCGLPDPGERPRIWIAGCGTFQPYLFATANPRAAIVATDLAERSLAAARRRCRWHGQRNVELQAADLTDARTLPDGPFDVIECYGVLMCLEDPLAALRQLAARLAPHGVLRLMVYPYFGRQRIFALQRAAKLLGLDHRHRAHPARLRRLVEVLPTDHPLRHAFVTYGDVRTDAGVADAFLHAHDRGFTGIELGELVGAAGLAAGHWFHRPWGQPRRMAERLGLGGDDFAVVHYLDLWQELRGNFVVCLRRRHPLPAPPPAPLRPHPLLCWNAPHLPLSTRLRLGLARLGGLRLADRTTAAGRRLSGREVRALTALDRAPAALRATLRAKGVLLGGRPPARHGDPPGDRSGDQLGAGAPPAAELAVGDAVANPLYRGLFSAWRCEGFAELGDLRRQIARWRPHADPLEDRTIPFGLTPFGSYASRRAEVDRVLAAVAPAAAGWAAVRLQREPERRDELRRLLRSAGLGAAMPDDPARCRELWATLCGHRLPALALEPA